MEPATPPADGAPPPGAGEPVNVPSAPSPPTPRGGGRRIALVVIGIVVGILGLVLALAGGGILIAQQALRDGDGYFSTAKKPFATTGRALVTRDLSVVGGTQQSLAEDALATVRVTAVAPGGRPVFVGIARAADVDRYLNGVSRSVVEDVQLHPFRATYTNIGGVRAPPPPGGRPFWAASASGPGVQRVAWEVRGGTWSVVVMNRDGSPGVAVLASVGAKIAHLTAIATGLLVAGLLLLALAALALVGGLRRRGPHAGVPGGGLATAARPVVLEGRLDEGQRRWLWLVKWILAIPHWFVLAFLWLAFWVLSICAFFAILVTGRYPRGIFDFNVGVMRWTWRVSFYSYSALGTDRYPPFALRDVPDYPARFDVAYPERLSRGLVLVKWWLLAIPQYIVVAILTGGWGMGIARSWGGPDSGWTWWQDLPGLIGVLTLFGAVALLFTSRYPRGIFNLVIGLNRWVYRVGAYVALMRDEYPPFRLDQGELEPEER
jgi:hypothetical protein